MIEAIPSSLYNDLSKKLIDIVLGSQDKNAISTDLAKKIIYLWRQDQLTTPVGLNALFEASLIIDAEATYTVLDTLGLTNIVYALQQIFYKKQ